MTVGRRGGHFRVTHSFAPDPDHRKVEAALDFWAGALADGVLAQRLGGDRPLARLHFGPKSRVKAGRASRSRKAVPGDG